MQEFHPKEFHKCSTCDKVFTSSALLDKHKSTHVGSKPFSCDLCNKSYQVKHPLHTQMIVLTPDYFMLSLALVATAIIRFVVP